ncbi:hypothetical protein B0H11DRAFT_1939741 [Mycena galericulata]|nr:hypothetical protein B0H11DRAFT_1939741 [Mycena galericulata]
MSISSFSKLTVSLLVWSSRCVYPGPNIATLPSTTINSTHWKWVFRCQNCAYECAMNGWAEAWTSALLPTSPHAGFFYFFDFAEAHVSGILERGGRRALVGLSGTGWLTPEGARRRAQGAAETLHTRNALLIFVDPQVDTVRPFWRRVERAWIACWGTTRPLLGAAEWVGIVEGDGVCFEVFMGDAQALVKVLLIPHPAPADESVFPAQLLLSQMSHARMQAEQGSGRRLWCIAALHGVCGLAWTWPFPFALRAACVRGSFHVLGFRLWCGFLRWRRVMSGTMGSVDGRASIEPLPPDSFFGGHDCPPLCAFHLCWAKWMRCIVLLKTAPGSVVKTVSRRVRAASQSPSSPVSHLHYTRHLSGP